MRSTDTRQLKRTKDGAYRSGAGKVPCDHCGLIDDCAKAPVNECAEFMPSLPFQSDEGLGHIANTVRVGKAWIDRLEIGQTIALWDVAKQQFFGRAKVLFKEAGKIQPMLEKHAHANHLMLERPADEAAEALFNWQRRNYGPRIIHDETNLTAIYLLRDHDQPKG